MTEGELRQEMKAFEEKLPSHEKLTEWAQATGFDVNRVKAIYADVIGDPDPWGPDKFFVDDHQ
jgi:hypothetical protein